jgi:LPXTG-motif cell wall-anchored protein
MRKRSVLALLLILGLVAGTALAVPPSQLKWIKFTTDTKILLSDGTILDPGNYTIAKVRSVGQRTTVVVGPETMDRIIATLFGVPNLTMQSTAEGVFVFVNGCDTGAPRALKAWSPPGVQPSGMTQGYDFMYDQARHDALQNCNPDVKIAQSPMPAAKPAAKPAPPPPPPPAEAAAAPAPAPEPAAEPAPKKLPKTASNTPLIMVIGIAALAGAALLRRLA